MKPQLVLKTLLLLAATTYSSLPTNAASPPHRKHLLNDARNGPQSQHAKAPHDTAYQFIRIEVEGATNISPFEINNRGIVAGTFVDAHDNTHTFLWMAGQLAIVDDHAGAKHTAVPAITESGLLFGNWGDDYVQHAGFYDLKTNKWTALPDIEGYPLNIGARMTESGNAVGWACRDNWYVELDCVGWVRRQNEYTFITVPGATATYPFSINNRGEVVGYSITPPYDYRGFTYGNGKLNDPFIVNMPFGPVTSMAFDIRENGEVLGHAQVDPDPYVLPQPILVDRNSVAVLPLVEGYFTVGQGMNERGDLTGYYWDQLGMQGFVALKKGKN
jgi:probable HAF family extracellular repeat protein